MDTPDFSVNNDHFKVVFLTDSRNWSSDGHGSDVLQKCTASVRLTVLKLLTYFANGTAGQATHLRWGYKFFNSIDNPPCKRETLKEFTESNVEIFEEQVLKEFEAGLHYIPKRPKIVFSTSEEKKNNNLHKTGLSVQHALADVLQDFQWEGPDIRSPVKASSAVRTRSRSAPSKSNSHNSRPNSNFVFLLMPCPRHQKDVSSFFGLTKDHKWTVQEFKDYVVPPNAGLQDKLQQNAISLLWIDTDALHSHPPVSKPHITSTLK